MKPTRLARHDPRRNDALGLVRRMVKAGNFTKSDVDRWKEELGDDVVAGIVEDLAPKKRKSGKSGKSTPAKEPTAKHERE